MLRTSVDDTCCYYYLRIYFLSFQIFFSALVLLLREKIKTETKETVLNIIISEL